MTMNALELKRKEEEREELEHRLEMKQRMSLLDDAVVHQPQPGYPERSWTSRGVPERRESVRYPPGSQRDSYSGGRR